MNYRVLSLSEIKENNRTVCLSTLRFFGKCHKCGVVKHLLETKCNSEKTVKDIISCIKRNAQCEPNVTPEAIEAYLEIIKTRKAHSKALENFENM